MSVQISFSRTEAPLTRAPDVRALLHRLADEYPERWRAAQHADVARIAFYLSIVIRNVRRPYQGTRCRPPPIHRSRPGARYVRVFGRNWLGYASRHGWVRRSRRWPIARCGPFPFLCSDIYLLGRARPGA
jgi:hypothetical protein